MDISQALKVEKKSLGLKNIFFVSSNDKIIFPGEPTQIIDLGWFSQIKGLLQQIKQVRLTHKPLFQVVYLPLFDKSTFQWTKMPFLIVFSPVFLKHRFYGVGIAVIDLKRYFTTRFQQAFPLQRETLLVLDNEGRIIFSSQQPFYNQFKKLLKKIPEHYRQLFQLWKRPISPRNSFEVFWPTSNLKQFRPGYLINVKFTLSGKEVFWVLGVCPKDVIVQEFLGNYKENLLLSGLIVLGLLSLFLIYHLSYKRYLENISTFKQASDSWVNPFVIVDFERNFLYINPRFKRLFGLPSKKCMGFLKPTKPKWHNDMLNSLYAGQSYVVERESFITKEGQKIYVKIAFSPIKDDTGQTKAVAVEFVDITKQVELEEELKNYSQGLEQLVKEKTKDLEERERQYRDIFENQLMGIFVMDTKGKFLLCNEAFKKMIGYNDEEVRNMDVKTICSPTEKLVLDKAIELCLSKNKYFYQECRIHPRSGQTIFADVLLQATEFKGQKAILGFVYDATQRKILLDRLREQDRIAVLGEMAAGVAHDINNLLMLIMGNLELANLLLDKDPQKAKKHLQLAISTVQEGHEISRRLYVYAHKRLQALEIIEDLNALIKETIKITEPIWKTAPQKEGRHIDIKTELLPLKPVAGNSAELKEVFINLIKNAVEAIPQDGEIVIKTWCEGDKNCVMVKDSGVGIPEALQKKIFEPFFTTKGKKGTGVGLAVAQGVIKAHGGEIKVKSKEGEGTAFYIYLPVVKPELAQVISEKPEVAGKESMPSMILVVDDEPVVVEVITEMLKTLGVEVLSTTSAQEALEIFKKHQSEIDLVITDLGMPGMNGFELAKAIKAVKAEVPVVLLTGWGDTITDEEQTKYQIDYVLSKPVTIEGLRQVLARLIKRRTQHGKG